MERPSHSTFPSEHPFANRLVSSGLALSVPFAILWALVQGLVMHALPPVPDITGRVIDEPKKHVVLPPPPMPPIQRTKITLIDPGMPKLPPVDNPYTDGSGGGGTGGTKLVPPLPPLGPTRAVSGIAASHTQPPYPVIEERLGNQGAVTLRLTVTADGHVAKADIVTSSGHPRLDEAAQAWIVAHWLYKPALDNGNPIASQATATVIFNLKNLP